jgi:hypothetical protein
MGAHPSTLAVFGVVIGMAAFLVIMRLLSSLLFGVSTTDPVGVRK